MSTVDQQNSPKHLQSTPNLQSAQASQSNPDAQSVKNTPQGGRNLVILGVGAIILTIITTSLSLMLYRTSGDIYLDRSRPGFLPDETEAATEDPLPESNYSFSDTGNLTKEDLETYSRELDQLITELHKYDDVYDPDTLSDTSLGIPSELPEESSDH